MVYTYDKTEAGEVIRYILLHAGEKFETIRVQDVKELPGTLPYCCLPVLELDNGKRLGGTLAVAQYLGEKFGLSFEDSFHELELFSHE